MFLYSIETHWNQKQTNKFFVCKNSHFCIIVRMWLWTWIEEDLETNLNESTQTSESRFVYIFLN